MKLGYITRQDPNDVSAYSGTHFHMFQALQGSFTEIIPFGPVKQSFPLLPKIYGRLLRLRTDKIYKYQYNIGLAKRAAKLIDKKIREEQPDALLASLMSPEVAYLKSGVPLYITTDATFPLLKDMYNSHSNLHPKSIKEALHLEQKAFERATKLLLPLQWLADSAMKDYGISASKIEVIPYGSNLGLEFDEGEVTSMINRRATNTRLSLLFVGVRWEEKGGPFAVDVIDALQKMQVSSELIIAGCDPEIAANKSYIRKVGFFDKSDQVQKEAFIELYKKAQFFVMPTRAECVGMSFIEAASMGLPAIGTKVGGVPEAVLEGETGIVIDSDESAEEVANRIIEIWKSKDQYKLMASSAFKHQQEKMNWKRWGEKVKAVI